MRVYQLHILASDDCEGQDLDEWFPSLQAAIARRRELRKDMDCEWDALGDLRIDRIELRELPPLRLALAILNRRGFVARREEVVPGYGSDVSNEEG